MPSEGPADHQLQLVAALLEEARARDVPPLLDFIPQLSPGFVRPDHLAPLARELEQVFQKPLRILDSAPPRHSKTELFLHWFAWVLKKRPKTLIAFVTYGDSLAVEKGRRARYLAREAGVALAEDAQSAHDWKTTGGGGLKSTSIEGGLIGRGFDIIVFDDPYKNHEKAESEEWRAKVMELWKSTANTRLEPRGSLIVNAARWHHLDIIGELSKEKGWDHMNFPAINDDGKTVLWPYRWPLEELLRIKEDQGSRRFEAIYQGNPSPDSGGIYQRDWFRHRYQALPKIDFRVLAIDGAWKEGVANDYSVIADWGYSDLLKNFFVIDVWRNRVQLPDLIRAINDRANVVSAFGMSIPRPHKILIEDTASGIGAIQILKRETVLPVVGIPVAGTTKEGRASKVSPLAESGRVWLPSDAPWVGDWIQEHCHFPAEHDDQVDTTSHALDCLSDPIGRKQRQPIRPIGSIFDR